MSPDALLFDLQALGPELSATVREPWPLAILLLCESRGEACPSDMNLVSTCCFACLNSVV